MKIKVVDGSISAVLTLISGVPEFKQPYGATEFQRRSNSPFFKILIGQINEESVGFKVGYDRYQNQKTYYSWMGGVLPEYRNKGVAAALQLELESWCKQQGFTQLRFKTRNNHVKMIHFGVKNGFYLVDLEKKTTK